MQPVRPNGVNAGLTNCGPPTVITLSQLESLTNNTIIPDKRSLTPPCTTTYNGRTYPTYVELDGMTVDTNPYTGDCNAIIQGYCDVHLEFPCTVSAGCLFEIDQTWFAAGYTYPVNTQGTGSISQGTVINATGFLYIDEHGIHELHPTVSVSVVGGSPPATCSNGAIDPPGCVTCPSGYFMQNGICVVQPVPLSTSFTYAPTSPSINSPVTFTATAVGGTGPYTVNWSFGDGATGIGATVTHTYTSSRSFTVTDNVTDSSVPSQTVTRFSNITILGNSNGGSTTGPSGGCSLCGVLRQPTTLMEILVVGGGITLTPLLAATIRSRSKLQRVKRRLLEASMKS
jgi:PKD domain-containing protein